MASNLSSSTTDPTKAAQIAQQIVEVLAAHDPDTRNRSIRAALALLGHDEPSEDSRDDRAEHASLAEFFNRSEKMKPGESAQLCAAYYYALHGAAPFSLDDIRTIGAEAGVILPDRLDKTFKSAAHNGKKLFQSAGRAAFKPTAGGGVAFAERWGVRPSRRIKAVIAKEIGATS